MASIVVAPRTFAERHARQLHRLIRRRLDQETPLQTASRLSVRPRHHSATVTFGVATTRPRLLRMGVDLHRALLAPLERDERSCVERDRRAGHADFVADETPLRVETASLLARRPALTAERRDERVTPFLVRDVSNRIADDPRDVAAVDALRAALEDLRLLGGERDRQVRRAAGRFFILTS